MGSDDGRKPRRTKKTTRSSLPEAEVGVKVEPTQGSQKSGNDGSHASSESTGNSILKQMNLNTQRKKSRSSKPEPKSSPKYTYMIVIIMCLWVVYYAGTMFMNNTNIEQGTDTADNTEELKEGTDTSRVKNNETLTVGSDNTPNKGTDVLGAKRQAKTEEEIEASLWDGLLTSATEVQNQEIIPNDKNKAAIDKMGNVSPENEAERKDSGMSVDDATNDASLRKISDTSSAKNTKIQDESLTKASNEEEDLDVTESKGAGMIAGKKKLRPVAFAEGDSQQPQEIGDSKKLISDGHQDEVGTLPARENKEDEEKLVTLQGGEKALSLDNLQDSSQNDQQDGEGDAVSQKSDGHLEHGEKSKILAPKGGQEGESQDSHQQEVGKIISRDGDGQMSTRGIGMVVSHPGDNETLEQGSPQLTMSNRLQDEAEEVSIQNNDGIKVQKGRTELMPQTVGVMGTHKNQDEHEGESEVMSQDSNSANVQNGNGKITTPYGNEDEDVQVLSQHGQQLGESESEIVLSNGVDQMSGTGKMISYNDKDSTLPQDKQLDENDEPLSQDVGGQFEQQEGERGGDGQVSEKGENQMISTDNDGLIDQGKMQQRGNSGGHFQKQVGDLQQSVAKDGKANQMLSQDDEEEPRKDGNMQPRASKMDDKMSNDGSDENTGILHGNHITQNGNQLMQKQLQGDNQMMRPIGMTNEKVRSHTSPQDSMSQNNQDMVNDEDNPNRVEMSDNPKYVTPDGSIQNDLQQNQDLKEEYDTDQNSESISRTPTGQLMTSTNGDQIQREVISGRDEQFEAQYQPQIGMEMNGDSNSKVLSHGQQRVESQNRMEDQSIQSNDQRGPMDDFSKSNDVVQDGNQQKSTMGYPIQQSGKAKESKMGQSQNSISIANGNDMAESDITEQAEDQMQQMDNQFSTENSNRRRLSTHHRSHIPSTLDVQIEEYVHNHVLFENLVNVDQDLPFQESNQVPYFWHIHKSGGSTLKHLMVCLERVQTRRMTLPTCNDDEDTIHTCKLEWGTVVNADASSPEGIERINKLGLLREHIPNLVIDTSRVFEALSILSKERRGRLFIVMRDPVERAISKYYYTKIATWERNWHPEIVNMTMIEFANSRYCYDNWVTRRLVNKMTPGTLLTPEDLAIAKEILRQKALILLTNDMSQSSDRMVKYFGWPTTEYQQWCINKFAVDEPINTNPHPIPDQNSPEWQAIRTKNFFDVELYAYALQLFDAQGRLVEELVSMESPMHSIPNRLSSTQTSEVQQQNGWTTKSMESQLAPKMGQGKLTQQFMEERTGNPPMMTSQENVPLQQRGVMLEGTQIDKNQQELNQGVHYETLRQQGNVDSIILKGQRPEMTRAELQTELQQQREVTFRGSSSQTASQNSPVLMQQINQPLKSMLRDSQRIQQQQPQGDSRFFNRDQQENEKIPENPQRNQVQYNNPSRYEVH